MNQTPMTELEAVNFLLSTIGESPINSIEDPGHVDAVTARQTIHLVSRSMQNKGWHWNTDQGLTLAASLPLGEVTLPPDTLRVDTVYPDGDLDVVSRGQRLYDRRNHTYQIGRSIKVDIVRFLPFAELPEAARWYTTVTAARMFQEKSVGSETLAKFTRDDEKKAWADLMHEESEVADYNVFTDSYFMTELVDR